MSALKPGPKRGRDVRKMDKPYTGREIVFTCSNGWTIERVIPEEYAMEGFFMGHCLGRDERDPDAHRHDEVLSLREPDGTPHITCVKGVMTGRGNQAPKDHYQGLFREYMPEAKAVVPTDYALEWSKEHESCS